MKHMRRAAALVLAILLSVPALAQAPQRHVATAHALSKFSHFYHGSQVSLLATVSIAGAFNVAALSEKQRAVIVWQQSQTLDEKAGQVVVTGTFLDVGRLEKTDPKLANVDIGRILETMTDGRWPGRDELFLLTAARSEKYEPAVAASLRDIALDPARWAGKTVTVAGRFRGKNLLGDQPVPPNKSQWEYVIRVADASVWVSGLRPRGRGFTLDPTARRDTREWIRIQGIVHHESPLVWIEAKSIDLAKPETEEQDTKPVVPPGPPPEIVFSAPLSGEDNVPTNVVLRVQFSRDINPDTLPDQVAVAYALRPDGSSPGQAPKASTTYRPANRSVEIRFAEPLAAFTTVFVAFGDQIKATDGVAMKPARISFSTGR